MHTAICALRTCQGERMSNGNAFYRGLMFGLAISAPLWVVLGILIVHWLH